MSTARILVPGDYLDGYREAGRPEGISDALHALLADVDAVGEGVHRRAVLDVPVSLLPALAEVAYRHFMTWGNEQNQRKHSLSREEHRTLIRRARSAFLVYKQARPSGVRVRSADPSDSALGDSEA